MASVKQLKELIDAVENTKFDMNRALPYIKHVGQGSWNDIISGEAKYYKFLPLVLDILKPEQVVELGSAAGTSALMMLSHLPANSNLYACSIPEPEGEFRFIKEEYPNLHMIRGDDLDLKIWRGVNLEATQVWFIDTEHTYEQLHAELELYNKFFRPGALVFLDDITLNDGMARAWNEIEYPKLALPGWHSYSNTGFGVFAV